MSQEEEHQGESQEECNDSPSELPTNPRGNEKETTKHGHTTNRRHSNRNPVKKILMFLWNKEYQPAFQNIINLIAVGVAVWLAIVTYRVYQQAVGQTKIARDAADAAKTSADAAKQSADLQKQALDSQIAAKKQSDKADGERIKREIAQYNLQKTNDSTQIASLQETQKEFEIENKPMIQIIDLTLDNVVTGGKPVIKFNFKNYGKQPVKMMNNNIQIYYWHDVNMPPFNSRYQIDTVSAYLGEGALYQEKRTVRIPITKSDSIAIKNGISAYYINGYLPFKNIVTNTESIYYYRYRIGYVAGGFNADGIKDTTIDIVPKKVKTKK